MIHSIEVCVCNKVLRAVVHSIEVCVCNRVLGL